jgi:hypothetical protein
MSSVTYSAERKCFDAILCSTRPFSFGSENSLNKLEASGLTKENGNQIVYIEMA